MAAVEPEIEQVGCSGTIIGARVGVFADHRLVRAADCRITAVGGAGIGVAAVDRRVETAARGRVAAVGGAGVAVVAVEYKAYQKYADAVCFQRYGSQ